MNLTIESAQDLARKAKAVADAADTSGSIPALACVRLSADPDMPVLELLASSHDYATCTTTDATVTEGGVVVVPARPFARVLGSMSGTITLETEDEYLVITSKRGEASLQVVPAEQYPDIAAPDGEWTALGGAWANVLSLLHFTNASMPRYVSVTFDGEGGAWATDTYSMGNAQIPSTIGAGIVPVKALTLARESLGDEVGCSMSTNRVYFRGDEGWVSATTIMGDLNTGKWEPQIPTETPHSIVTDAGDLLDAIAFATSVEDPNAAAIRKILVRPEDGGLLVARSVQDLGSASMLIDAEVDWPSQFLIRPDRLVSTVKATGCSSVALRGSADLKRVMVEGHGEAAPIRQMVIPFVR